MITPEMLLHMRLQGDGQRLLALGHGLFLRPTGRHRAGKVGKPQAEQAIVFALENRRIEPLAHVGAP